MPPPDQTDIRLTLHEIHADMELARNASSKAANQVRLLAVSKRKPLEAIGAAYQAGQRLFGENYVDEGVEKILALGDLDIEWHFIGQIQSRRTRLIAENFDWVQSVDRLKVAERLSMQRPESLAPLSICLQYNPDGEIQKGGVVTGTELDELAAACHELPGLSLRGLMSIPAPRTDPESQHAVFARIHHEFEQLAGRYGSIDTLSMGMSGDMHAAIAEGATMVRIGTRIFGQRNT